MKCLPASAIRLLSTTDNWQRTKSNKLEVRTKKLEVEQFKLRHSEDRMPYKLMVNGRSHTVDVPADMPLLWVIRDVVGLKGTKFGCGIGQCGACTVHVRGKAVRSCQTQVSTVGEGAITTLEGLSPEGSHPVQIAWQDVDVPQCGYCQAGQMMSAAALPATIAKPSDADIDKA